MFRPGLVLTRTARKLDALSAEILLGGEGVVGAAAQREIGFGVLASVRECRHMVELEAVSLRATPSRVVSVGAAPPLSRTKTVRRTEAGTCVPRRRGCRRTKGI
jgi:hypothetical protein